jgi:endonuclease/exonuclease/phosphatase (EEP) superfamily protein YafD
MTLPSANSNSPQLPLKQRFQQEWQQIHWPRIWTIVARPIFVPILLCSLLAYGGGWHQILELTTHYRWQYFLGSLFVLGLYGLARRKIEIILCLFCVGLNAVDILPWYIPAAQTVAGQPLRVMVANVLTNNDRYADFIQAVNQENPVLLVVMELDAVWQKQLAPLRQRFPYLIEQPSSDNFGIALFSQFPLEQSKIQYWAAGAYQVPSITAEIMVEQKRLSLVATHPLPPLKSDYFRDRNQQMVEMANYVRQLKNPAIVMGDLNMSMWSPYFRQFIRATGMKSARQGFGVQPSWPVDSPLLQIPIDHCLVSPTISVRQHRIGPDVGSDHYPLIADLAL